MRAFSVLFSSLFVVVVAPCAPLAPGEPAASICRLRLADGRSHANLNCAPFDASEAGQ